ncbi:MAG: ABC transporter permease [Candidatus Aminicenantes bacterium]|nr:ABC transporter permease [Candidatus Aminicenantes bacterium]
MFIIYFKTAWRNLKRSKLYSVINILGLALGGACGLLIFLFIKFELSYDRYHPNAQQTYRIVSEGNYVGTSAPIAPYLAQNLPEIEDFVRLDFFSRRTNSFFAAGLNRHFEPRFYLADPSIFDFFAVTFIHGSPDTALGSSDGIVLTESAAARYFGEKNPMGKMITLENKWDFVVTGVIHDLPPNTHLHFDILTSFANLERLHGWKYFDQWGSMNWLTYIRLAASTSPEAVEEKINRLFEAQRGEKAKPLALQALPDIHLKSHIRGEVEPGGSIKTIWFCSAIAVILFSIACINFVNLATARAVRRAREVGMRKAVGARRSQLMAQFLMETALLILLATVFALMLAYIFLPAFNNMVQRPLSFTTLAKIQTAGVLFLFFIIMVSSAGLYPALFLSAFEPKKVLRTSTSISAGGGLVRRSLVVFQFAIATVFLVSIFIVKEQLHFLKTKDLGLVKERVISIPLTKVNIPRYELIKDEIKRHPEIISASANNFSFSQNLYNHGLWYEGIGDKNIYLRWIPADFDFLETFQIELKEGRNFSRDITSDTMRAYIFNETAVRFFGEEIVKERHFDLFRDGKWRAPVIGIVKDYHFRSLYEEVEPVALCVCPTLFQYISVRVTGQNLPGVLAHLENTWNQFNPGKPFEYFFLSDDFDSLYKNEYRLEKIFGWVSTLAILISCFGLFALAQFLTRQRTKEIGIRKVLGASTGRIIRLLTEDFTKWVLAANVIAWPLAYYFMHNWLQNFAYRISIGLWCFAAASGATLVLALLTVIYQVFKTASHNPVDSIRYE